MMFINTLYGGNNNISKFAVVKPKAPIMNVGFRQLQDLMLIKLLSGGK